MEEKLLNNFKEFISEKTGLRIRSQDAENLHRIILARTRFQKLSSPEEYYNLLHTSTDESKLELQELAALLTVGESYFFRDKGQFELLRGAILPDLINRRKGSRTLRIWSAGCSTGEEPYSLAMLINELLPQREDWNILILGTDMRDDFLRKAKSGVYSDWSFRMVPPEIRDKYFHRKRDMWELDARIRHMVTYRLGNLLNDKFPSHENELHDLDLVLCRNVFIYYHKNAVSAIVEKLSDTLNEGGYLMTAHGELYSSLPKILEPRMFPESLVYQKIKDVSACIAAFAIQLPGFVKSAAREAIPAMPQLPPTPPLKAQDAGVSHTKTTARHQQTSAPHISEVEVLFRQGAYTETIELGKLFISQNPGNCKALYLIAAAYANLGEHANAFEYLQQTTKADPFAFEPYYLRAHIAGENGDPEAAKEALKKVIYLKPSSVAAYLELAALYENEGDAERALKMRKSAVEILQALPQHAVIEPYDNMTAAKLILYLQKLM